MEHIDWEERRYEIALHAMQAIISNSHDKDYRTESYGTTYKDSASEIAYRSVAYADALIHRLIQEKK